jgi:hypothetical protein
VSGRWQKSQMDLAFPVGQRGGAPTPTGEGTEPPMAARSPERPANSGPSMEEVLERVNLKAALQRVKANKGSPGLDGMTVGELPGYLREHWPALRDQVRQGTYRPQPVRRVEIPKPPFPSRQRPGLLRGLQESQRGHEGPLLLSGEPGPGEPTPVGALPRTFQILLVSIVLGPYDPPAEGALPEGGRELDEAE